MFFILLRASNKEKILNTQVELNRRPWDFMLWCSPLSHRDSMVSKAHYNVHLWHTLCILLGSVSYRSKALIGHFTAGCEINFFFCDSHLAPKIFKVVANLKKVGRHFQRQTKPFFFIHCHRSRNWVREKIFNVLQNGH